jgi:acetyl-CoA acetyltransferase
MFRTIVNEMAPSKVRYGVAILCVDSDQGAAASFERAT